MKKKNLKNIISTYEADYQGQKVTVYRIKPKDKKVVNNARSNFTNCPNCLSKLILDECGLQKCSGDRIVIWEQEFVKFKELNETQQEEYMKQISYDSVFLDLYKRWEYSQNNPDEPFSCGFTNNIIFPMPTCNTIIPDPTQVKVIEKKLGRKLTEDEIFGEIELFEYQGMVLKDYRKGAKKIKISIIKFPEDCY